MEREQKDEFVKAKSTLRKLRWTAGIEEKEPEGRDQQLRLQYREADYGSAPKGLMYGLQCLDSWLLLAADPMMVT